MIALSVMLHTIHPCLSCTHHNLWYVSYTWYITLTITIEYIAMLTVLKCRLRYQNGLRWENKTVRRSKFDANLRQKAQLTTKPLDWWLHCKQLKFQLIVERQICRQPQRQASSIGPPGVHFRQQLGIEHCHCQVTANFIYQPILHTINNNNSFTALFPVSWYQQQLHLNPH